MEQPYLPSSVICAVCGHALEEHHSSDSCPQCGEQRSIVASIPAEGAFAGKTTLTLECVNPVLLEQLARKIVVKVKRGGKSKRPAKDVLVFERIGPGKTLKKHRVEEQRPDGSWELCHLEAEPQNDRAKGQTSP